VLGDPDQPHTYTYVPDIGAGLAVLGEHPAAGRVWHLPDDPATRSTRELAEMAVPDARVKAVPRCCCAWPDCATRPYARSSR
jgi:nucleoside-diphosphate-sugar epimerase